MGSLGPNKDPQALIVPPPLHPGDWVGVVAPSSPFDPEQARRSLSWLGERYRLRFDPALFERQGFLAGTDEQRSAALNAALADPELAAVVTMRGGHGLLRIFDNIDFGSLRAHPKWLVGFSDPTLLHLGAWSQRVASIHAANLATLADTELDWQTEWLFALSHPTARRVYAGKGCHHGATCGPLVGGNLTMLTHAAAANRLWLPDGCVLALEDVNEAPYRVDRMLAALRLAGHLDRLGGLALGDFSASPHPSHGVSCAEVLEESARVLGVPAVMELPFGHEIHNRPLPLGLNAVVDGDAGTLEVGLLPTSSHW